MPNAQRLESQVARTLLNGFETHFARMKQTGLSAKAFFEAQDFGAIRRLVSERIGWYDTRVAECVTQLASTFPPDVFSDARWGEVKLAYISLLLDHRQPELAEVFFNSVTTRVLHRRYFKNRFMFVRPSISTEYLDLEEPSYRCYYPARTGLRSTLSTLVRDFDLKKPFAHLDRDVNNVVRSLRRGMPRPLKLESSFQLQVLESLLYRGQEAYIVGRAVNGLTMVPFVVPIVHDGAGRLILDAVLLDAKQLAILFSSTRAYFIGDIDVPSTWVRFLQHMLPSKPAWELYAMLGFGKMSKALFYRDWLHHLRHSSDVLILAPGTPGLVMVVLTLPSFPYVFKLIRDRPRPPKDVDPHRVRERYRMVKRIDRAGRLADTLEYADVAIPKARFSAEALLELRSEVASLVSEEADVIVLKHVYIERRMTPLDLALRRERGSALEQLVDDWGSCLEELATANIFAGDLLSKNFGVTRLGRVVFYDYDELDSVTATTFRTLPKALDDDDELRNEAWFHVGPKDVFPEEWRPFLLTDTHIARVFEEKHRGLFTAEFWNAIKERLESGRPLRVSPYPDSVRFSVPHREDTSQNVRRPR